MTPEAESNSAKKQPIYLCPKLVGVVALILYLLTLNHWVTLSSLPVVAQITGWDWHPGTMIWRAEPIFPLLQILTLPARLLPATWQPISLNLFSAICAALTLSLLARSIRLMPHDRTKEQRQRPLGENATLAVRFSFVPPLLAVLALGLQLTFWENAITATGEMLNLLIFSFLIYSLLQFRVTQNEQWLVRFALVYGLGMTNSWALIGYFPFFLAAVVWIKGFSFFNWKFLARITGWGALGLVLYLLLPLISGVTTGDNFWTSLHDELAHQKGILTAIPRWLAVILGFPTWIALIFIGIRWPSFEGDMSPAGNVLSTFMFRVFHLVIFLAALWFFLDIEYSPRELEPRISFLSFYYMAALSVGYLAGYILLIFGEVPMNVWLRRGGLFKFFNPVALALVGIALLSLPLALACRNYPKIRKVNSHVLRDYFTEVAKALPAKPALVLSDDRKWLYLTQAASRDLGRTQQDLLIDTGAYPHREYLGYLRSHYSEFRKSVPDPAFLPPIVESQTDLVNYFGLASQHYPVYYLHPSFGYFFELFYPVPHGPVYELKPYPDVWLQPPHVTSEQVGENEDFWRRMLQSPMATSKATNEWDDAAMISLFLSRGLNNWAVELQRAGRLSDAGRQFAEAARLNPQNVLAQINRKYNTRLAAGNAEPMDTEELLTQSITQFGSLISLVQMGGPSDEPGINLQYAGYLAAGGNLRQAAGLFQRRLELLPKDPVGELGLARCYLDLDQPDETLQLVKTLRQQNHKDTFELAQAEAIAILRKNDYAKAETIIEQARQQNTNDVYHLNALINFYRAAAYSAQQRSQTNQAVVRFQKTLATMNELITLLNSPAHESLNSSEIPDALLRRAEIEMHLGQYSNAVNTLTDVVNREPANTVGLFNRAVCQVQLKNLDAARQDYEKLLKIGLKDSYDVYLGLAQVADLGNDKKTAARNFKRYLKYAPTYTAEYAFVTRRLKAVEQGQ